VADLGVQRPPSGWVREPVESPLAQGSRAAWRWASGERDAVGATWVMAGRAEVSLSTVVVVAVVVVIGVT
jgi:hypothetical protein